MSRWRFTLVDLLACIAVLAMLSSAFLTVSNGLMETVARIRCGSNLHLIGRCIQMYMNDNKGELPRAEFDPARIDRPTWCTPYQANPKLGAFGDPNPFVQPKPP